MRAVLVKAQSAAVDDPTTLTDIGVSFQTDGKIAVDSAKLALVHQQLDLLATAVFRWAGQAWPGVPMEWTVQQEEPPADREAAALAEAPPRRWTTTLSLALPRLGTVDVRLSLAGPAVQAALVAVEPATLARLREGGGALSQRLESAGLRLDELQITPRAAP